MRIFCCECKKNIAARLTDGKEIYPHRYDLHSLPFWKCDQCGNYVGCHHKTEKRTKPLGCIPNSEIKKARKEIHKILDPLWQSGYVRRDLLYAAISKHIGWKYHTAKIRDIDEARRIYRFIRDTFNQR